MYVSISTSYFTCMYVGGEIFCMYVSISTSYFTYRW